MVKWEIPETLEPQSDLRVKTNRTKRGLSEGLQPMNTRFPGLIAMMAVALLLTDAGAGKPGYPALKAGKASAFSPDADVRAIIDRELKGSGKQRLVEHGYDIYARTVGNHQLLMITSQHMAPAEIGAKFLLSANGKELLLAEGGSLLGVLNEAYGKKATWDSFDDAYAAEAMSILDVFEPQNYGVQLIKSINDIEGLVKDLDPDLRAMVIPPARYTDSIGRKSYLAYFYARRGGRVIRLKIHFSRENAKPQEYSLCTVSDFVGEYYLPR
jgi:hypothetical protein